MLGALLLDTLMFALAVLGPGVLLLRALLRDADALVIWAGGATIGLFLVPLATYSLAVALSTHVSASLLALTGALISLPSGVIVWRHTRTPRHIAGS